MDKMEKNITVFKNFSDTKNPKYFDIDTCSNDFTRIIDYKTGGNNKEHQYFDNEYTQLAYYALSIRQKYGVNVESASVEFIRRLGNAYRGEKLIVGNEEPIKIEVDISEERLKSVYWSTIEVAKEIENFYIKNSNK